MNNKKVIVFDFDGVIVDSIPNAAEYFLQIHPGLTRKDYDDLHRGNFRDNQDKLNEFRIKESEEKQKERSEEYYKLKLEKSLVFPGIKSLLEELYANGCVLVINTSAKIKSCIPVLQRDGVEELFDFIATVETERKKNKKMMLIAERYGINPEDMLFVTDAVGDVLEAGIVGVPTVCVTWGVHKREDFSQDTYKNIVAVVDTVEELKTVLI